MRPASAQACVSGARFGDRGVGQPVDGVPSHPLGAAALERARGDFGSGPLASTAPRLIVRDGAVERIRCSELQPRERNGKESGELNDRFATRGTGAP